MNQRAETLHASVVAVKAAKDGFVQWNQQHEDTIVATAKSRDEVLAARDAYVAKRKPVLDAFLFAFQALAIAATQTDDPSFKTAQAAATTAITAATSFSAGGP